MKVATLQTTQRVTFTFIATALVPLGIGLLNTNAWVGVTCIVCGLLALVAREYFKSE